MKKFIIAAALALGVFAFSPAFSSSADEYYYGTTPDYMKRQWQGQYDAPSTTIIKKRERREHRVYYIDPDNDVEYYREYRYIAPDNEVEYRYYIEQPDGDIEYYYYRD